MRLFVSALFSLALLTSADAADLNAEQIESELVGNAISWWENGGWHAGDLFLMPDGRAELTVKAPKASKDEGHWALHGNQICTTWSSLRNTIPKCYSIQKLDDGSYTTSGGNTFTVLVAGV